MPSKIDELKSKIYGALGDPQAPWYGSDLVSWVGDYIEEVEKRVTKLESVYDHPNSDDPKQRYLYEIRCAIKLLRENGSEYALGVAVQLDQFYSRARKALKKSNAKPVCGCGYCDY